MPVQPGRTSYRRPTAPPRRPRRDTEPVASDEAPLARTVPEEPVDPERPDAAGQG
ncbi:hypothetical protein [Modestobacter sp. I12A-02662]|uniref:hypothetical protein n=1 Tax=Modestobacter sp. I12A-02662 TaxID=1730496 RepID=UPI0034DDF752